MQLADAKEAIYFQGEYVKDLMAPTDYPSFDVDEVSRMFVEWKNHKHEDIMGYRDNNYHSILTGNLQPKHHTPWIEAMDDSMESYLGVKGERCNVF
jgi:trimethylamine monooxygenase